MTCLDTRPFLPGSRMTTASVQRFVFLLLPTYSPMDVSIAIEALSEANTAAARPAFEWRVHSETGQSVRSRSGVSFAVDGRLDDIETNATILLCGGNRMETPASRELLNFLRKASRYGATLGTLGSGSAILAQAGLLPEKKVAAHWAISSAMQETFPELDVRQQVFTKTGKSMTCAGGIATLDMFLALIAESQGIDCAHRAAAALVCSSVRDQENEQTLSLRCQVGSQNEHLIAAMEAMKAAIEYPLSAAQIAEKIGVSCRQLERLFAKNLGMSPKKYSDKLRLENARRLLQQTNMPILEIAIASGFSSTTHLSKLYRRRFGISPHEERGVATC